NTVFYNQPQNFFTVYGNILPIAGLILLSLFLALLSAYVNSIRTKHGLEELRRSRDKLAESQEMLRYQLEYDEVLDILNRRTITEQLRNNVPQDAVYSVVIVDIDGFKALNENYGHSLADSILQYLVALFKEMAAEGGWQIARYGGDEFLLFIPDQTLTIESPAIQDILAGIRAPIPLGDETLAITASMGISNSDGITPAEQHLINAEIAMYEAKNHGKNGAALYDEEMKERAREEVVIKEKLQEAFEHDGFYMVYQPQINSKTKKVSGYEALVRMKAPGMFPGKFIPVAERNGWIWRIGRITTELAIKQLADWREAGYELHPVSVNFSGNQLNDHGYIDFVKGLLEEYKVPAEYLEIEITEGLFLEKSALADEIFKRFKEMGIRLLMDDFGTGYSSLGYLSYIPVDVIKLDKSLVDTYLVDGKDSFIMNIIHLMHDLNKEMIIEGVEEKWQFERLRDFGADVIQGYYFSKPIPANEAITFTVGDDK
ncbi:MAG: GGDEF domain-containing protein, partial [Treponema sp.]|nr:GGDEF domain-containing protein [Treponema sp.]